MPNRTNIWKEVVRTYQETEITYPALKLITLAQWALESGWGKSELAKSHFNFAGLKYRARMSDHAEPVDYEAHDGLDTYCKFKSIEHFITGYWHFIDSGPYPDWEMYSDDPLGYVSHLKESGYAGDPNYITNIIRIYEELSDELGIVEEIDRPTRSFFGDIAPPLFEPVQGTQHRTRGRYPNKLEGLIVHYDAFRIRKTGSREENSDFRTRQTISMGDNNGYRYACISRSGRIFVPENWNWTHWGSHAGKSECPETKRRSVSQYYVGMEMNNPGLLYESQEDGVFCPWYNSKLNDKRRVILDERGRCYRVSSNDEWYSREDVRLAEEANITRGYYLPYTEDQFLSLVAVIAFLHENFDTFRIDRVFGHDEVSPGRKQDPGGALAYNGNLMTMPQFREYLTQNLPAPSRFMS